MARLKTLDESDLSDETLNALEPVRMKGALAPVYLQYANSQPALQAYLGMEQALCRGALDERTLEAIKLAVSERTGCDFCLSVHSFKGKKAGLDAATQMAIRQGVATGDARLDAVLDIVRTLQTRRGALSEPLLQNARQQGYDDAALLDICMAMATIVFTNISNHVNDTELSLPPAPTLLKPE